MENDAAIAACQPKILSYTNRHQFEYAGACGGWLDALGFAFSRGRIFDVLENDEEQYDYVADIFWASGAALFVRANVFIEIGGFDSYFFAHMEEIDLCWRMKLAGHAIKCCPASVVHHVGGGTLPKGNIRKVFLNFRNNLIMMVKNLPWYEKVWKLPVRVMLDIVFALKNLLAGQPAPCKAVFRAHFAVLSWLFIKKKQTGKLRKQPLKNLPGVYNKSIVWAHFVEKKARFSEIVKKKLP
jgi:GT2 family glycosyltransferase